MLPLHEIKIFLQRTPASLQDIVFELRNIIAEVTPDALLGYMRGVPESYGADERPKKLEWMVRQAKSLAGK